MFTILFVDLYEWFLDQYANIVSAYIVYPIQKIYLKKIPSKPNHALS